MTEEPPVDDAIRRFVAEVTTEWREGIHDCQPHLEDLMTRVTGPSWDVRGVNDLLAMGTVTVSRSGRVAGHVLRLADSLAARGRPARMATRSEAPVGLRPHDLAAVWGTALGQLVDLWRTGSLELLKLGSVERSIPSSHCNEIRVRRVDGRVPRLLVRNLVGESFGRQLDMEVVTFTEKDSGDPDVVLIDCCIDEARGQSIQGDIYRGEVVDENGAVIARLVLDAGS
jgi:hypothetical protein